MWRIWNHWMIAFWLKYACPEYYYCDTIQINWLLYSYSAHVILSKLFSMPQFVWQLHSQVAYAIYERSHLLWQLISSLENCVCTICSRINHIIRHIHALRTEQESHTLDRSHKSFMMSLADALFIRDMSSFLLSSLDTRSKACPGSSILCIP